MKYILLICFIAAVSFVTAQIAPPKVQWQRCFGGTEADFVADFKPTIDGCFIIAGSSSSNDGDATLNHGYRDGWIIKLDAAYNIQWQRSYGGILNESISSIMQTPDGGYIFLGSANNYGNGDLPNAGFGNYDLWVTKIDPLGSIQWSKLYGGTELEVPGNIAATLDNNYIIAGFTRSNDGNVSGLHGVPGSDNDIWVIKISATGNLIWQKCYGGSKQDDVPVIAVSSAGGYVVAATTESANGDLTNINPSAHEEGWLFKIDDTGNILWQKCLGGNPIGDKFTGIVQTADQSFVLTGMVGVDNAKGIDLWFVKVDNAGNIIYNKHFGGSGYENGDNIIITLDGGYLISGFSESSDGDVCNNKGYGDAWLVKLKSDATIEWQKTYGGSMDERSRVNAFELANGSLLITATTNSNNGDVSGNHSQSMDVWLAELSFPGIASYASVSISADNMAMCAGKTISFIPSPVNGGNDPAYEWYVNDTLVERRKDTLNIDTLSHGDSVYVILTSNNACITHPVARSNTIIVSITSSVTPAITISVSDSTICEDDNVIFTTSINNGGSSPSYEWMINDSSTRINSPSFSLNKLRHKDSVSCYLKNTEGCLTDTVVQSNIITISVGRKPTILLPDDTAIFEGDTFQLQPIVTGIIATYQWLPPIGLSSSIVKDPFVFPSSTTAYKLVTTSVNDCGVAEANINITVLNPVRIPNAFSPNKDGINDLWLIENIVDYAGCVVEVFNRNGQLVFRSNGYSKPWNGTTNGRELPAGTYYYLMDLKNGLKMLSGSVTIIR